MLDNPKMLKTFGTKIRSTDKIAPTQKAIMIAEEPFTSPRKKPKTAMYLISPKPIQRPLDSININRNGNTNTIPEIVLPISSE